jgi:DNA-binding transcriptional ArsR family regulator
METMATTPTHEAIEAPSLDEIDGLTVLQALSDPVRLEIVRQLSACSASSELKCSQIELPVTKSTASHHFKILLAAGLVLAREQGTSKFMRLRREELDERFPGLLDSVLRATG